MTVSSTTLAWLHERARVSDVLHRFAQHLDTKSWQDWIDLFAADGVLELPGTTKDKAVLQADGGPRGLMSMHATHHMSSNHRIEIDGDSAHANSYVQAVHVLDADDPTSLWVVGGWYDHHLRREADDWKIVRVGLRHVWSQGESPDERRARRDR